MYLVEIEGISGNGYFVGMHESIGGGAGIQKALNWADRFPYSQFPRFRYYHLGGMLDLITPHSCTRRELSEQEWIERRDPAKPCTFVLPSYVSQESAQAVLNKAFPNANL